MVMMKIRQKNGKPDIFMVTEAGIIGKTGFNSAGICLYLNALSTNQAPKGLPLHLAMRGTWTAAHWQRPSAPPPGSRWGAVPTL